jgi:hypothetical protein
MELKKTLIGANPSAMISHIPDLCVRDRTITVSKTKVLHIFRDRRPMAIEWIEENLPRLILLDKPQMDKLLQWFWTEMPDNGFLEFDFGPRVLYFCSLEKK